MISIRRQEIFEIANDLFGGMGGGSIEDEQRRFLHVSGDVISILFHEVLVHSSSRLLTLLRTPPTGFRCVPNLALDEERGDVKTITPHGESRSVSESVATGFNNSITPAYSKNGRER